MDEVEEFLSHYGVKGMRWGVVKKNLRTHRAREAQRVADRAREVADIRPNAINNRGAQKTQARADLLKRSAEGKQTPQDRAKKIAKGAILAGILVLAFGPVVPKSMAPAKPSKSVVDILKKTQGEQMSSLTRTFREGHMNADQYKNFSEKLNARYARQIAEAMKGGQ